MAHTLNFTSCDLVGQKFEHSRDGFRGEVNRVILKGVSDARGFGQNDFKIELDDRFPETAQLRLWTSDRKLLLFRRPHMIRTLETLD
jgi:hypothetical protein